MKLNNQEIQSVLIIGLIIALRLFGIFLILPVFSIYSIKYPGATLTLAGIAFGIYALVQSVLQIPFGLASDKYGRKPVLIIGLLCFSAGSLLCGYAETITELIIARAIQGSGAVGAVAIASLGDSTREQVRAQGFTITGIIIGIAFIISLVIGPAIANQFGFESLFFILSFIGLIAILVTLAFFPDLKVTKQEKTSFMIIKRLKEIEIRRLFTATFIISFLLNMFLFIYPLSWKELNFDFKNFWLVYLIIISPSALFVFPYVRRAERIGNLKIPIYIGFITIGGGLLIYFFQSIHVITLYFAGGLFFIGHTLFQSLLPTFLTQRFPSSSRGTSSGFYNLSNFFGASIGGMVAGKLYETSQSLPLTVCLVLMTVWIMFGLPNPPGYRNKHDE
ncbi:MAG: MFS transporter [Candidatus Dadabacteria bacterium]|nr:MFS transporter [Candidatus Dadabacteria bacterium]NIQ15058.1 MFS transporter [Candidatus Dadabacteria bacterium]